MRMEKQETLQWHVSTKQLLDELLSNFTSRQVIDPFKILYNILQQVAQRAIELDDFKLHQLMLRLHLYAISDPDHKDYNDSLAMKLMNAKTEEEFRKIMSQS